jgi:hypothetical protein
MSDFDSTRNRVLPVMSKKMASVLIGYGFVLAGLGLVLQNIAPAFAKITFIASLAGGGLCLLWGVAALAGLKGRAWAILNAMAAGFMLLSQAVHVWMESSSGGSANLAVRLLLTAMMVLTIGMLIYLLHGERPPEFDHPGPTRPPR